MADEEKRAHVRIEINEEFHLVDGLLNEYVANISRGGIFLRCDAELPAGTKVQLKFSVLLDDVETIEGVGEVMRTNSTGQQGLGIRFVSLTDASRDVIEQVCVRQEEG